jgi:hypothetical protein
MFAPQRLSWVLAGILVLGCASAQASRSPARPPAVKSPKDVRLFGDRLPQCPYETLGRVEARRQGGMSIEAMVNSFRRQARDRGGDAVIHVEWRGDARGATTPRQLVQYYTNRPVLTGDFIPFDDGIVAGTVIRFLDRACRR